MSTQFWGWFIVTCGLFWTLFLGLLYVAARV